MVFGIGRRDAQDAQEEPQPAKVPYRLASYEHDHEGKRLRSSNVVYSFWSAAKYVLILSVILWWLPMFGQMIAGYVGGRRAGGPWRGVAASILPVVCLYVVITGFDSGFFPSHLFGVAIAPAAISTALSEGVPFVSPYIHFSSEYLGSFVSALAGASPYGINTYVLTVAFAYVGGILAEQSRREIEFNSGAMTSSTTVLVSEQPSSQQLPGHVPCGSQHGLAHMVSSVFPWSRSHEHDQGHPMMHSGRGSRAWSQAVPMRYESHSGAPGAAACLPPAPRHPADAHVLSGGTTKRRNPRGHRRLKHKGADSWQRADRRASQHYSSARRLRTPAPARDAHDERRHAPARTASHSRVPVIVPGDQKSIRRARRVIDEDWGRAERRIRFQDPPAVRRYPSATAQEDSQEEPEPHHRAPRPPANHWDSI